VIEIIRKRMFVRSSLFVCIRLFSPISSIKMAKGNTMAQFENLGELVKMAIFDA